MLIQVADLHSAYQEVVRASLAGTQTVSVLVFVPLTVDSIAACCILYELFRRDNILNQFVPVRGYSDLQAQISQRLEDETLPPSLVFLNCGGSVSLMRMFADAFNVSTAYVIDSHRPIHLENLDARVDRVKVFDDSQSLFDELCLLEDSAQDESASIVIEGRHKGRSSGRKVRKLIDPEAPDAVQMAQNSRFSDPAALQLYSLASARNHTSLSVLWFAILGLTEHFLLEHIDTIRYETLFNALQNEASRLTSGIELFTKVHMNDEDVVAPVNSITVPLAANLYIQPCVDLRCNLMRHWTLMESMSASPFIASRLRLWYHAGMERLQLLLAKMGVPLRDANTAYIAMSSDIRESLVRRFDDWCDRFGLTGVAFPSFLLKRGYAAPLAASDVVLAVRARLQDNEDYSAAFAENFAVVKLVGNQNLLSEGVETAKARAKVVMALGMELMNRKNASIVNAGPFRITQIHNPSERGFPVEASSLVDLGQFLIQAFREDEEIVLPMVVAAKDAATQAWTVVALSTGFEFGEVESSRFGAYFKQAAEQSEIELVTDSFDSYVCQVPDDLFPGFVDQLTLQAFREE